LVDDELLVNFFLRLADEREPTRIHFRFVLALILMRKRLLKYEETDRNDSREVWCMRLVRDKSLHRVENPQLNEEQIERVSRELGVILHGDMGNFDDLAETVDVPAEDVLDETGGVNNE
jgi:hypothetical protein